MRVSAVLKQFLLVYEDTRIGCIANNIMVRNRKHGHGYIHG